MTSGGLTTVEFFAYLRSLDIHVFLDGDRLRCNAPEGALTPDVRTELTERKAALIALLQQLTGKTNGANRLVPRSRDHLLPLSFAQQRLWFLDQLVPDNPFYNMPAAVRLQGHLNLSALEQAFDAIVQRHETLRTTFVRMGDRPTQLIAPHLPLSLSVVDVQTFPACARDAAVQQLATEEAHRPFNLATAPLLRVKLLKLDETDHILLLNLHHIVSDGWSLGVLIRELGVLYTAFLDGKPSPLTALPIQYADFACWQREWLQGDVLDAQLAYWRRQLTALPLLMLPTDRPRPSVQGHRGATHPLQLSPTLTATLASLSQTEGATLFMTLLAAFQVLLYRYTGQEDVAVGSPIANRNRSEIEGLIGFFVNSLVLRSDLSGNPTFREVLGRVREVALAAYAHQDVPFEKLVEELHPERDLSRNPLFQVAFALQNAPIEPLELPELTLTPWQLDVGTTRFDLEFHLWQRSQGLSGLWEQPADGISGFVAYSTALFDAATIARMVEHFQTLLEGIAGNPDARLSDLPMLTAREQQQLLVEWNQTHVPYAHDQCFHQLFETQASQTPDAIAVVFDDRSLTYRELDQRSNQLAHYLQQFNVQPDRLIGICLERSLEMIIAVLGVLKAGAAYVPLDPAYPRDRLSFMLTDAQVPILITQQSLVAALPAIQGQVVCLDTASSTIDRQSQEAPTTQVTADHLAYLIYTSGSTGTPKGVLIEHRGLCNVVAAQGQAFNLPPQSRVLQFSSLNFDASVFEMLLAFGGGGTLYIAPPAARLLGSSLSQFLQAHHITAAILTPAVLAVLPETELPALQTVIVGGEACSGELVDRWAKKRRFFNAYGPTETTIWATVAQLQPGESPAIGRPVANTQIYLLDAHHQPVAIGVIGELYIGGAGVARGYLNRPELTAERFVESEVSGVGYGVSEGHLIAEEAGEAGEERGVGEERETRGHGDTEIRSRRTQKSKLRSQEPKHNSKTSTPDTRHPTPDTRLYKTGDLARYRSDGKLEFLGRVDEQVKLRGFRIELGEIETVLSQHPAVQDAVVTVHQTGIGEKRLLAYTVLNGNGLNGKGTQAALERQLQAEQLKQWETLYNQIYARSTPDSEPTFNLVGWQSSYTGQPIAAEQMREWLHYRTEQILARKPDRVLEIGCGTGLLLFQLAPHCTQYCGTDFSAVSLDTIQQQLVRQPLPQVTLRHQPADDFTHLDDASFDAVILNSVVQYFPSLDYFMQVLEGAIRIVAPGGFIFIGDVRSLPLLSAFHAAVQLHQADPALDKNWLQQQVQRSLFEEPELVIDPALFHALRDRFPTIRHAHIQLTRGRHHNEMTQFRYNVVLQIESQPQPKPPLQLPLAQGVDCCLDWTEQLTPPAIHQQLAATQPAMLHIKGVPNARVMTAIQTIAWLTSDAAPDTMPTTIGQWRQTLESASQAGIDPEDWWQLETALPYRIDVRWSENDSDRYDVVCLRQSALINGLEPPTLMPVPCSWSSYANQPLQSQVARHLIPQLRDYLEQRLPAYMVPAAFMVLDALPLTANGKLDRRALPTPDAMRLEAGNQVAPRSPSETKLVSLWAELLGLKQVGIHDNFFALGGHSLLATQLTSRIRDAFGVELPLRSLFEAPTIAQLALLIDQLEMAPVTQPAIVPLARTAHRRPRSSLTQENQSE